MKNTVFYLRRKFSLLSKEKLKEEIFLDRKYENILNKNFGHHTFEKEKQGLAAFKSVAKRNRRITQMQVMYLSNLKSLDITLEKHFLPFYLEFFLDNLGAVSTKHREWFLQQIAQIENINTIDFVIVQVSRDQVITGSQYVGEYCALSHLFSIPFLQFSSFITLISSPIYSIFYWKINNQQ